MLLGPSTVSTRISTPMLISCSTCRRRGAPPGTRRRWKPPRTRISLIELLLETKELERLADLVGRTGNNALENLSHYSTEPAAKKLERIRPDIAARLWCAQGMRIVNAKKSKYYDAALSNFERGQRCFERAGLINQWQRIVKKVRFDHHRKVGFMVGFEEIVGGSGPSRRPSFLQRAKTRWT